MGAYQAHGSVAHPQGTLLTWAAMSLGGYQVDSRGNRFVNEDHGYSEHALDVLGLEGGTAVAVFDQRIFDQISEFEDFRLCREMGAVKESESIEGLAPVFGLDPAVLAATHEAFQRAARGLAQDSFGRGNLTEPLKPPYYGVRVTGALFHTQGRFEGGRPGPGPAGRTGRRYRIYMRVAARLWGSPAVAFMGICRPMGCWPLWCWGKSPGNPPAGRFWMNNFHSRAGSGGDG